jgi:hypothetical protein
LSLKTHKFADKRSFRKPYEKADKEAGPMSCS